MRIGILFFVWKSKENWTKLKIILKFDEGKV